MVGGSGGAPRVRAEAGQRRVASSPAAHAVSVCQFAPLYPNVALFPSASTAAVRLFAES